jgi:uncharacterized protein YjdB
LDEHLYTMGVGGTTLNLVASLTPGSPDDPSVTWSTSDASIVSISPSGLQGTAGTCTLTAVKPGTATITVMTTDGGFDDICTVKVVGVTLDETSWTLDSTIEQDFTLIATPTNTDPTFVWSISPGTAATVDQTGKVTALLDEDGTETVTVTYDVTTDNSGPATVSASCTVTVSSTGPSPAPATVAIVSPILAPVNGASMFPTSLLLGLFGGSTSNIATAIALGGAPNMGFVWTVAGPPSIERLSQ